MNKKEFQFYIPEEGGEVKMRTKKEEKFNTQDRTPTEPYPGKVYRKEKEPCCNPHSTELQGGLKFDSKKLRMDLIPPEVEEALATVLSYGATKYQDRNWEKGIAYSRIYGALRRHLLQWVMGHRRDKESGLPTLWHALCCLAFLVTYEFRGMDEWDDLREGE